MCIRDRVKVKGCIANGIPEETAKFIWDKMAKFAEYAFNKPHAAAYAYLAYITAWLSYHYPLEFNVSLLNSVLAVSYTHLAYYVKSTKGANTHKKGG